MGNCVVGPLPPSSELRLNFLMLMGGYDQDLLPSVDVDLAVSDVALWWC